VRLFETAVASGRRARANHPAGDRNLSELAVRWLERRIGPLRGSRVVVAGAGRMGRAAGAALARRGATITIASRSVERARDVAARVGGTASDLADGARLASRGAGAIVALRGPWLQLSAGIAIPIVDLSFPLSVRADARATLGDSFADVDRIFREAASLQTDSEAGLDFRTDAAAIVDEAVAAYRAWSAGRASVSTLRALRDRSEEQRSAELSRLLRRIPGLEPRERALVEAFSERLVAGLLHGPTVALRDDLDGSAARAAERLFGL
jgi:glutamyl-tRNA reductase